MTVCPLVTLPLIMTAAGPADNGRAARPAPPAAVPYAVSGYWLYARTERRQWQETLDRIRTLGADTVIQFGPRMVHVSRKDLADASRYPPACTDLLRQFEADLAAARSKARLRHVFTLTSYEDFGLSLIVSPPWDKRIEVRDRIVSRLVIPVDSGAGAGGDRFDPAVTQEFDLVFVVGRRADSVAMLLDEASRRRMAVFVGIPVPPAHPRYPWDPWNEVLTTYLR